MKLQEFNHKDEQLDELLGGLGKTVGKAAGGTAKAVGAVAGGIAGLGSAFKKGWQAGKTTVAGDDEPAGDSGGGAASSDSGGGSSTGGTAQGGSGTGGTTSTGTAQGGSATGGTGTATPKPTAQGGTAQGGKTTSTGTAQGGTGAAGGTATPNPTAQGGTAQGGTATPKPTAQGGAGGGAAQGGGEENADKIGALQARISKLDADSQKDIMQLLQKQAATAKPETKPQATDKPADQAATTTDQPGTTDKPADQSNRGVEQPGKPTFTGVPEKPAADTDQSSNQGGGKLTPDQFGKMAQDLAGGAQKANDAKAKQTTQPAPQPAATEKPAPAAGNTAQQDLKAKLKAGGGLAKTSGSGFKQGMVKGNMRLGAGRGGVSMSHVPDGNPLIENKKFSLFRK